MSKLRNFVRLSDKNKFVIGTNTKTVGKPPTGRWYEIFEPSCCEAFAVAGTPGGNTFTIVRVFCGDQLLAIYDVQSTNLATVASQLNANYPAVGEWTGDATGLTLSSNVCPALSITLAYASSGSQATTTSTTTTTTSTLPPTSSTTTTTTTV